MVNLDDKKRNVPRWVSFFIDEIQLCTLILLKLNILLKKY